MTGDGDRQHVAVIGGGISGLAAAWLLAHRHEVTLFEAKNYAGGHTNTVDISIGRRSHPVDTGFLVFNDRNYPNLVALFRELGVSSRPSPMSFGVSLDGGRLEWAGSGLDAVFAQRRNIVSPRFLGMLRDILRFNRTGESSLDRAARTGITVGELLEQGRYGSAFREEYLLPMAAAIWSSPCSDILHFPAATFLRFCRNHGLLQIAGRPQWRTVDGGGREYVRRLCAGLTDLRLSTPVERVDRGPADVCVTTARGAERFDAVVFATHAPDTLRMIRDADSAERAVLSAVRYQPNVAWLHTDPSLLPRRRKVWSAWNYLGARAIDGARPVCVSYLINRLQSLPFPEPVVVTLNPIREPDPRHRIACFEYEHPLLDASALAAQAGLGRLQGKRRSWFAGAWTGYGFHEDGLRSALAVASGFGMRPRWAVA